MAGIEPGQFRQPAAHKGAVRIEFPPLQDGVEHAEIGRGVGAGDPLPSRGIAGPVRVTERCCRSRFRRRRVGASSSNRVGVTREGGNELRGVASEDVEPSADALKGLGEGARSDLSSDQRLAPPNGRPDRVSSPM
jgi:hypothetical protein